MFSPAKSPRPGVVPTPELLQNIQASNPNSSAYALDLHNQSLTSLSALESFTKLRSLDCSFNNLSSLENIQPLGPNLKELVAYSNKLADIYCLGDCSNLTHLQLHDNKLTSLPPTFKQLTNLKEITLHRNKLTSLSNLGLCTSLTHIDASNNELSTPTTTSLDLLVSLNYLLLNSNDLGPSLPPCLKKLNNLEELQVSDNQLTNLKNIPRNITILMASRNHLSATLSLPSLKNLTELHLKSNRLKTLPSTLATTCPSLDLLDVSDNRIDTLANITSSITPLLHIKELSVSGNPCTPRDINNNIFGDVCMRWWFAVISSCPPLEVCDDLIANSDDVAATVAALGREREINDRRSQPSARPKSARRKKATDVLKKTTDSITAAPSSTVPLVKPPLAHSARESMSTKLEAIDDIQTKFGDIKNRLSKARGLCRPDGELPKLKNNKTTIGGPRVKVKLDLAPTKAEDFSKYDFSEPADDVENNSEDDTTNAPKRSRFDRVSKKHNIIISDDSTPQQQQPTTTKSKSKLSKALEFDDTYNNSTLEVSFPPPQSSLTNSVRSSSSSSSRQQRSSSAIKNIIKSANNRVKQAHAYSGSKNSHLMPSSKQQKVTKKSNPLPPTKNLPPPIENDANEFHPEYEHYEGAAFEDEFDVGFEAKPTDSPQKSSALKLFNLDEFDSSSEDEDMHGGRIGIAPSTSASSSPSESPPPPTESTGPVDFNPFFPGRKITVTDSNLTHKNSPSPPPHPKTSVADTRKRLLQKALDNSDTPEFTEAVEKENQQQQLMYQAEAEKISSELDELAVGIAIGNPVGGISDDIIAMLGKKGEGEEGEGEEGEGVRGGGGGRYGPMDDVVIPLPSPRFQSESVKTAVRRKAPTNLKQRNGLGGSRGFKMPKKKAGDGE